ncbi:ATP-binding cassette domain-containing protein [Mycoplasma struthionis]|uniref:ATP-binding cassette domain-containing protein n=1 Tax=Mycoplasma struthionis TaxID=538220 RepID=UPI0024822A69|nr:ATP-binding cassette domain-containing protein [Mycoplasma struthionis]
MKSNLILKAKNGFGKSSILKLLYLLFEIKSGKIKINNIESKNINKLSYRKRVYLNNIMHYLPNDFLIKILCSENVETMNLFVYNLEKYNLVSILDSCNLSLNKKIEDNGNNLSSGQKQIVNLLVLFTKKFDLVLLDEAFENVSIEIFEQLKLAILDFQKDAIFIEISHTNKIINENSPFLTLNW